MSSCSRQSSSLVATGNCDSIATRKIEDCIVHQWIRRRREGQVWKRRPRMWEDIETNIHTRCGTFDLSQQNPLHQLYQRREAAHQDFVLNLTIFSFGFYGVGESYPRKGGLSTAQAISWRGYANKERGRCGYAEQCSSPLEPPAERDHL